MKTKSIIFGIFLAITLVTFVGFIYGEIVLVYPVQKSYNFDIKLPDAVDVSPGDNVTINGNITNIGQYWIHELELQLNGLPFNYKIEPSYFEDLRILRDWNPQQGVFRVPYNFTIQISVPNDAFGAYLVNVTGQEHRSWRQVVNSTTFILHVLSTARISTSDLFVPQTVRESELFNISVDVTNNGFAAASITVTLDAPEDWSGDREQSVIVNGNSTQTITFDVTPTNTSGQVSMTLAYVSAEGPQNITKAGPTIIPFKVGETAPAGTGLEGLVDFLTSLGPIVVSVILLILAIVAWNVYKIIMFYRSRKKPEKIKESKKEVEAESTSTPSNNNQPL